MPEEPTLVQLAERILEYARKIEASTSAAASSQLDSTTDLPEDLQKIRFAAIDDSDKFNSLVRGVTGREAKFQRSWDLNPFMDVSCMKIIYRFRIAQAVPLDGPISYADLASKCGMDQAQLERILRYAFTMDVFQQPEPGKIAHTVDSRKLATDTNFFDSLGFEMQETMPAAIAIAEALQKWPGSDEPTHTGWNVHYDTEANMYQVVSQDTARLRQMGGAMTHWSCGAPEAARNTALQYPWSKVADGSGTLVDIGGGTGHISVAVAEHNPSMKCVVQDLPGASDGGKATLPGHLTERVQFAIHNYHEPQPVKDADFYLFSMVLHNLPDKIVKSVLRQVIPALKPGARILWCDRIVPKRGEVPECTYREILGVDLAMMALLNGKERTVEQEIEVLKDVDPRLKYNAIYKLGGGSPYTIVEAIWTP